MGSTQARNHHDSLVCSTSIALDFQRGKGAAATPSLERSRTPWTPTAALGATTSLLLSFYIGAGKTSKSCRSTARSGRRDDGANAHDQRAGSWEGGVVKAEREAAERLTTRGPPQIGTADEPSQAHCRSTLAMLSACEFLPSSLLRPRGRVFCSVHSPRSFIARVRDSVPGLDLTILTNLSLLSTASAILRPGRGRSILSVYMSHAFNC